jgi:hypothetical protein
MNVLAVWDRVRTSIPRVMVPTEIYISRIGANFESILLSLFLQQKYFPSFVICRTFPVTETCEPFIRYGYDSCCSLFLSEGIAYNPQLFFDTRNKVVCVVS